MREERLVNAVNAGHSARHSPRCSARCSARYGDTREESSVASRDVIRPDRKLIEGFEKLSTPNISDALDRLGIAGGCKGITPVVHGTKLVGPAYTLKYVPAGTAPGTVGDYIDDVAPGDVVVIDNGGRTYCTVWGDLLTVMAVKRGVAGTVIDGVCRDVTRIRELRYPIFTRGCFMMTGKNRVELAEVNIPVAVSDVKVNPGDIVVGDDSGVLIVPRERAVEVLKIATQIAEAEDGIERAIEQGMTLAEARRAYSYHRLQDRQQ